MVIKVFFSVEVCKKFVFCKNFTTYVAKLCPIMATSEALISEKSR